jgi:hypothetical protein
VAAASRKRSDLLNVFVMFHSSYPAVGDIHILYEAARMSTGLLGVRQT